jgi:hypothetical protein
MFVDFFNEEQRKRDIEGSIYITDKERERAGGDTARPGPCLDPYGLYMYSIQLQTAQTCPGPAINPRILHRHSPFVPPASSPPPPPPSTQPHSYHLQFYSILSTPPHDARSRLLSSAEKEPSNPR